MIIQITGDRNWTNTAIIKAALKEVIREFGLTRENTIIVEGEANGADKLSAIVARQGGVLERNIKKYPAKWEDLETEPVLIRTRYDGTKYNALAGPNRNIEMLETEKPDIVLAFHNNISTSKGTKHMVTEAKKRGIEVRLWTDNGRAI